MPFARPALPRMVSQHAEEVAFLWVLRQKAVGRPDYDLDDLAKLDGRLTAHLDGLYIAGETAWNMVLENLGTGRDGELFAAAMLAMPMGPQRFQELLDALVEKPELGQGLVSALGWLPWEGVRGIVANLLRSGNPRLVRWGLRAHAIQRQHPGPALEAALRSSDLVCAAAAARMAGELGCAELVRDLEVLLATPDESLRFWCAWSAVLLGSGRGLSTLAAFAENEGPYAERAALTVARSYQPAQAGPWLARMSSEPKRARRSLMAAGASGDPAVVPRLLAAMATAELARVAGEAFCMITGADLSMQDLTGKMPDGFVSGPTDDPEDEKVDLDPDEDLPWPSPELIGSWWRQNSSRFAPGKRYLVGHLVTKEILPTVLAQAYQRQRQAAAELLMLLPPRRPPVQPLFECRAQGTQQKARLPAG
jgi:uncharacterized protein (TIGR02270 family)